MSTNRCSSCRPIGDLLVEALELLIGAELLDGVAPGRFELGGRSSKRPQPAGQEAVAARGSLQAGDSRVIGVLVPALLEESRAELVCGSLDGDGELSGVVARLARERPLEPSPQRLGEGGAPTSLPHPPWSVPAQGEQGWG
ncbi:MAG: hypothetical protein ACYCSF_10810 [Acidimicrobiales bacterium]